MPIKSSNTGIMFNNIFNTLQHIQREPVPEQLWGSIQNAIERRRLQAIPVWMKVAAMIVTLLLMAEMITSIKKSNNSALPENTSYSFSQNNQWYHE